MFLKNLIIIQILNIFTCKGMKTENEVIKGNYKTPQNGAIYLNREHPLWILQDHKNRNHQIQNDLFKEQEKYETFKTFKFEKKKRPHLLTATKLRPFPGKSYFKTKAHKHVSKNAVQVPRNYLPFKNARISNSMPAARKYKNSKFLQNLPVFDAVPGEESFTQPTPIFIYTGKRGRMLFNTMLSRHKYPMQEPVPGQALYPPQPLLFKPKPLVENLKRKLNVTMIPFYAHEAIDPTARTSMASSSQPAKKSKKAKHYTAFFSPEQVRSQPVTHSTESHYDLEQHTTFRPLALDKPYANHRFETKPASTTTPLPHKKLEVTYTGGEDKFRITYEDDDNIALERPLSVPATTQSPPPYESYTLDNTYYAFPIYTMSKLLENKADSPEGSNNVSSESQTMETILDTALQGEKDSLISNQSNEDTWFILNSRYKGPLRKSSTHNIHSSKYVQAVPAKMLDTRTTYNIFP